MSTNSSVNTELEKVNSKWNRASQVLAKIQSNAAVFYLNKGSEVFIEALCYLLALAVFGLIFIMNTIFPFHVMGEILNNSDLKSHISNAHDLNTLNIAIKSMVALVGVLLIIIGLGRRRVRLKNNVIREAAGVVKEYEASLVSQKEVLQKQVDEAPNLLHKVEPKPFSSL